LTSPVREKLPNAPNVHPFTTFTGKVEVPAEQMFVGGGVGFGNVVPGDSKPACRSARLRKTRVPVAFCTNRLKMSVLLISAPTFSL